MANIQSRHFIVEYILL